MFGEGGGASLVHHAKSGFCKRYCGGRMYSPLERGRRGGEGGMLGGGYGGAGGGENGGGEGGVWWPKEARGCLPCSLLVVAGNKEEEEK